MTQSQFPAEKKNMTIETVNKQFHEAVCSTGMGWGENRNCSRNGISPSATGTGCKDGASPEIELTFQSHGVMSIMWQQGMAITRHSQRDVMFDFNKDPDSSSGNSQRREQTI